MDVQLALFETVEVQKKVQPRAPDGEWVSKRIANKYDKKMDALRETIKYMARLNAGLVKKNEDLKKQIKTN